MTAYGEPSDCATSDPAVHHSLTPGSGGRCHSIDSRWEVFSGREGQDVAAAAFEGEEVLEVVPHYHAAAPSIRA